MAPPIRSFIIVVITTIALFVLDGNVYAEKNRLAATLEQPNAAKDNSLKNFDYTGVQKVNFVIDSSDFSGSSVYEWLRAKGFRYYKGVKKRNRIELSGHEGALTLKAQKPASGYIINKSINLKEFCKVQIEWGIIQYPKDASYEKKINNEALSVYIFFGHDKLSSGSFVMPRSPYSISLFLSKNDLVNKAYLGRYYHKGGRFVCVGGPKPNETVVSEFDLVRAFQTYFGTEVPVVSGISLGMDTSSSGDGGKAAAFIKRIEFLM